MSKKTTLSARADAPKPHDCAADVEGGVKGHTYFVKMISGTAHYFKDIETNYEISALGLYCTEDIATSNRCRDVRMENGNCIRPLFQVGVIDKFFANDSCQGVINTLKRLSPALTSIVKTNVQNAYCNSIDSVVFAYNCPSPNNDYLFYIADARVTQSQNVNENINRAGAGNVCKMIAGTPVPGLEIFGSSCFYFNFGSRTDRKIYTNYFNFTLRKDSFYYDPYGIYTDGGEGRAARYCYDNDIKTLDEYLQKEPAIVDCTKYVSGGLSTSQLRFAGNNTYYSGTMGNVPLRLLTPQDVCKGTVRTFSCFAYASSMGLKTNTPNNQFMTNDEIVFTELDGNSIQNLNGYCTIQLPTTEEKFNQKLEFNQ